MNKDGNYVVLDAKSLSCHDLRKPQYNYDSLYLLSPDGNVLNEWHNDMVYFDDIKVMADNSYYGAFHLVDDMPEFKRRLYKLSSFSGSLQEITQYFAEQMSGLAVTGPLYFNPSGGTYNVGERMNFSLSIDPCYKSYDLYLVIISPAGEKLSIKNNGAIGKGITSYAHRLPRMMQLEKQVLSMTIPPGAPKGRYAIYACLIPTGKKADLLYAEYVRRCYVIVQ